jgi:hypothetical protein
MFRPHTPCCHKKLSDREKRLQEAAAFLAPAHWGVSLVAPMSPYRWGIGHADHLGENGADRPSSMVECAGSVPKPVRSALRFGGATAASR